MAQADRGTGPNPAMLSAKAKMSDRRTTPQSSKKMLPTYPMQSLRLPSFELL